MKTKLMLAALLSIAACGDDDTPPLIVEGGACSVDEECETGACLDQFMDGTVVSGGMCATSCTWVDGVGTCSEEGTTQACLQYTWTGEKWCFPTCSTNEDCRTEDGWECAWVGGDVTACIPPL